MSSSRDYSFLNFLFFCILLQRCIQNCNADQGCVNPQFGPEDKITIDFYFGAVDKDVGAIICKIINESNGLIKMVWRMGANIDVDSNGTVNCGTEDECEKNHRHSCYYKYYKDRYNNCGSSLPSRNDEITTCIANAGADDILIKNKNDYVNSKATVLPALVVNQVFDPCFTTYTYEDMKTYFCKAYKNELPLCCT